MLAVLIGSVHTIAHADASRPQADWARFRAVYPFNMQAIAISRPDAQGHRTLVISEPPASVTVDDLRNLSPLMSQIAVKSSRIGFDGRLSDAVVDLPPASQADVDSLVASLSSLLYGTSYKAYALPITDNAPVAHLAGLDVSLTSNQIWRWLVGDNAERDDGPWTLESGAKVALTLLIGGALCYVLLRRRRFGMTLIVMFVGASIVANAWPERGIEPSAGVLRFQPLQGGAPVTLRRILERGAPGVYASAERGLVVWCVARDADLGKMRAQAREFVLDADLVLGGVGFGDHVAIIGRERMNSVDALPPLRVETVMLLASANRNELAQSYERKFAFAGRVDNKRKLDWAPIYLSDQLIDTEYGSLLNVTDQMLKSWSLGGSVRYVNFKYADPASISPSTPVLTKTVKDGGSVTFNWNTKGAGYAIDRGGFDVYALHRTGALPIDYLSRDAQNVRDAEDAAYDWFGTLGDANLARVVEYAALYQLFVHFDIRASAAAAPHAPRFNRFHDATGRMIEKLAALDFSMRAGDEKQPGIADFIRRAQTTQSALRTYLQNATDAQRDALIDAVADPVAFRLAVFKDDEPSQKMAGLASRISELIQVVMLDSDARSSVAEAYIGDWNKRPDKGWIRTPSVVFSSARMLGSDVTGGHNLSATVLEYRAGSNVPRGTLQFVEKDGRTVALYNEADHDGLPEVERILGRDLGNRDPNLIQRDIESAFKRAGADTRNLNETLHLPSAALGNGGRGMGGGSVPPGGYSSGWSFAAQPGGSTDGHLLAAFATTRDATQLKVPFVIARDGKMQFSLLGPDGAYVQASNPPAAVDALRTLASQHPDGMIRVHFQGMDERSARSLLNSAKLQDPAATEVRLIATTDGTMKPASIEAVLNTRYEWKAVSAVRISQPFEEAGRVAVDVDLAIPAVAKEASIIVRIRLYFTNLRDAALVKLESIKTMLANLDSPDMMYAAWKLKQDLHQAYGSFDDLSIHIIDKQNKDFYLVNRPSGEACDEDDRLA
ncbi:hypothetical protein [Caballeronia sp. J97]|uniref:hypothetical protein n=1 Tax=Caballeronia sp. J97 TaxID=2805429 RepID=UPI002AB0BDCB|nr:hypothetical protein [Caballeronia sp. J97]